MKSRQEAAKRIVERPHDFKICEGCDSIVVANVELCPNCHAYKFNSSEYEIVKQAKILGSREQQSVTFEDLLWSTH